METERIRRGRIGAAMNNPPEMAVEDSRPARVLIVEDEPLVAENLRADLIDAGFVVVGVAARLERALKQIETAGFDIAILDANLAGISSAPAAAALAAGGIPYVVLSGYAREQLQSEFLDAVYVQKPYRTGPLLLTLQRLASRRRRSEPVDSPGPEGS